MRKTGLLALVILLIISCSKENSSNRLQSGSLSNLTTLDTARIPLNDLGTGTFMGEMGGLYPDGVNEPSGQYAADLLEVSNSIVPIDRLGNPSSVTTGKNAGKIVFISVGASVGGHMMKALIPKTTNNPATNPRLKLINCNQGAGFASLNNLMNPNDPYWTRVNQIITKQTSFQQVQVIYLETDDSARIAWPSKPNIVRTNLQTCVRTLKEKFPNLKLVYFLGRTKTFARVREWNKEPGPYYFGWGCKWAIQDQINGVPGTEYKGENAVAPMMTWGFYEWANETPRTTDGFSWNASQTVDGLHATTVGQDTLTTRFQNFLLTDQYASIWYASH